MKQCVAFALAPTPEQVAALTETVRQFNRAAQFVAESACENRVFNKHDLQRMTYSKLRAEYSLTAQMAIQAISKAVDSCKDVSKFRNLAMIAPPKIGEDDSMVYDHRIMSLKGCSGVSLRCLLTREIIESDPLFVMHGFGTNSVRSLGQAELVHFEDEFFLMLTTDVAYRTPERLHRIMEDMIQFVQNWVDSPEAGRAPRNVAALYRMIQPDDPQIVLQAAYAQVGLAAPVLSILSGGMATPTLGG